MRERTQLGHVRGRHPGLGGRSGLGGATSLHADEDEVL
jgi:hypothetical protein